MVAESASQLLLTRIDHEAKMLNVMRTLFEDGHLTDVTLACEGQLIHSHKLILSSVSNYFHTIFQNPMLRNQSNPVIVVKDMKISDLKAIIEFIYSGEVRIGGDQLESLVKSAETLDISGLNKIDPNPVKRVSQSSCKTNSMNKNVDSRNENGNNFVAKDSLAGKSDSHNDKSFQMKGLIAGEASSSSPQAASPLRGFRGNYLRTPLESSNGNKQSTFIVDKKDSSHENLSQANGDSSLLTGNKKRELRYNFRAKMKDEETKVNEEGLDKGKRANSVDKLGNKNGSESCITRRLSGIWDPIVRLKNTSVTGKMVNQNDCLKELVVERKLTNTNKTPEFKKPLEPVRKNKLVKPNDGSSGSTSLDSGDHGHPPDATDLEMQSCMRQLVYDKQNLKMNLKRDDDVQSVSSVTTRSQRSKMLESPGCVNMPKTTSASQNVATTRSKRVITDPTRSSSKSSLHKNERPERATIIPTRSGRVTRTSTRQIKGANGTRWQVRAAKLTAIASTRLSAKAKRKRVDWRAWFESQSKINANTIDKLRVRRADQTNDKARSVTDDSRENKARSTSESKPNVKGRANSFSNSEQGSRRQEQQKSLQPDNKKDHDNIPKMSERLSSIRESANNLNNSDNLTNGNRQSEPESRSKRKQSETSHQQETPKRDAYPTSNSQAAPMSTRSLRPKRVKTQSDGSEKMESLSEANTSNTSLSTLTSTETTPTSTPTSTSHVHQQSSGDKNI